MKNLFKDQQILAIIIGGVAATIITAWIFNPQSGPAGWIKGLSPSTQSILSGVVIALVLASVGLLVTVVRLQLRPNRRAAAGFERRHVRRRQDAVGSRAGDSRSAAQQGDREILKPWSGWCRSSARSTA